MCDNGRGRGVDDAKTRCRAMQPSDENEFEAIGRDIGDRLGDVGDPRVTAIIAEWVAKLTAGDRGTTELNYLKLLQFMMVNRRISRPFRRHPPPGRLPSLNEHLRPRASGDATPRGDPSRPAGATTSDACGRRTVSCYGGSQTDGEYDYNEGDEYYNDDDDGDYDDGVTMTTDDNESYSSRYDTVGVVTHSKRDGHLAGGGGGHTCCRGTNTTLATKNPHADLCDPCLDNVGLHLKKRHPGPMEAAYRDLLGDCALPVLTETERNTVSPEVLRVIQGVNDTTTLQDFYFQVALYTCDQGSLMMRMSDDMVDKFRAFVTDVFDSRAEHISDGLAYEQMAVRDKYSYLADRALNRATVALDFLREAMPKFNWHKYRSEPDAHLKRQILRRADGAGDKVGRGPAAEGCDGGATADGGGGGGRCGGDDDDGDDDEDDGARRQTVIKKIMYTLNWLRSEETRMNCQGDQLYEQRGDLNVQLAQLNAQLSEAQCQSAGDIGRHKDEITLLRQQSAEQVATIDRLLESIQLATADKKSQSNDC